MLGITLSDARVIYRYLSFSNKVFLHPFYKQTIRIAMGKQFLFCLRVRKFSIRFWSAISQKPHDLNLN